jgi:hypothetical protein
MTNILQFRTEQGSFEIELLDNAFVDQWLQHFLKMSQKYHMSIRPNSWPWVNRKANSQQDIDQAIDSVISATQLINKLHGVLPLPEKISRTQLTPLDLSAQQVLNRLHRYAVVAAQYRDRWIISQPFSFDWVPYEDTEFDYAVNLLNQNIHALEQYVTTPHKNKFCSAWKGTEILFDASKYSDVDIYHDDVDVDISDSMFPHLRLTGVDVWIKKDLLGKDFITAFADHDDPIEFDVRPPLMFSGGIHIHHNNGKDQIYQSTDFVNWLGTPANNFHGNYPLGNVIVGKQNTVNASTVQFLKLTTQ